MITNAKARYGLAIHWPNSSRIGKFIRERRIPSYAIPRKIDGTNALVALVDRAGRVMLQFRLAKIEKGRAIIGANGKHYPNGCYLVARKGSLRKPRLHDRARFAANRHVGSFVYFIENTGRPTFFDPGSASSAVEIPKPRSARREASHIIADNSGKHLSQPERELVNAFRRWTGTDALITGHLTHTPVHCDLFYPTRWILFEAKVSVRTEKLREALGQLLDYQRYFVRHPRLAVLLPHKPTKSMLDLFALRRITIVWKTNAGAFRDTANGELTSDLRDRGRP